MPPLQCFAGRLRLCCGPGMPGPYSARKLKREPADSRQTPFSCFIYLEFLRFLLCKEGTKKTLRQAYTDGTLRVPPPAASFFALPQDKKPPHSVGRWPVGAEGENIAIARNISGSRTVLSPTACGRSPLPEGAKGRTRLFLQSEPPHSVGRWPSKAMAGGALHALPRLYSSTLMYTNS